MTKRRAKGDGSVVKHGNRFLCRYWANMPDGTRERIAFHTDTKREGEMELRKLTAARDRGETVYNSKQTVGEYYREIWKPIIGRDLKATTVELYDRVFRLRILPIIGDKKLTKLTKSDMENLIKKINNSTSARQCKVTKSALSPMLDYAVADDVIRVNPMRLMNKKVMPKQKTKTREIWRRNELDKFLETAKNNSSYYPIYRLLSFYGVRRGEALGIRAEDVELRDGEKDRDGNEDWGTLHISQQVVVVNNRPVITTPKTEKSVRDLPLTKDFHDLFATYLSHTVSSGELLFHTANNTPIAPRNLERDYYKIVECAGLKRIPLHSFRHMACTLLIEAGVSVNIVQAILGHKSLSTTLEIYAHSPMKDKRAAIAALGESW